MTIKPIQTWYNGHHFRSRLEARWAVFFDVLQIPWQYEAQGYETKYGKYLPDFIIDLYDGPAIVEVKPYSYNESLESNYSLKLEEVSKGLKMPLYISGGFKPLREISYSGREQSDTEFMEIFNQGCWDNFHEFTVCPDCLTVGIEYEARAGRMTCCSGRSAYRKDYSDRDHHGNHVKLLDAYTAALSARF